MKTNRLLSFPKLKEAKKLDKELEKALQQLRQCEEVQIIMSADNRVQQQLERMKAETITTVHKWNFKKAMMKHRIIEATYQLLQLTFRMKQDNAELNLRVMKF